MAQYLTVAEFRSRTIMPGLDVDWLEANEPGFLDTILADWSDEIDARLRKRYAVPFSSPYPRVILRWLAALVTRTAFHKRGMNPSSAQDKAAIEDPATRAEAELKEAADAQNGLFDLPLKSTDPTSAISKGDVVGYSEQSPYRWTELQLRDAENEDYQ